MKDKTSLVIGCTISSKDSRAVRLVPLFLSMDSELTDYIANEIRAGAWLTETMRLASSVRPLQAHHEARRNLMQYSVSTISVIRSSKGFNR